MQTQRLIFAHVGDCAPDPKPEPAGSCLLLRENQSFPFPALRRIAVAAVLLGCVAGACAQMGPSADSHAQPATARSLPDSPSPTPNAEAAAGIGSISGFVLGKNGEVYSGVHVSLKESGVASAPTRTTDTDENGAFSFTGVPAGAFQLTLSSRGFVTQTVSGVVEPGENYAARSVVLPVANTSSDVHVHASIADIAQAQLKIEETQRVLGVFPNFYVSYDPHAAPLTTRQKYQLAWKTSVDPITWAMTGAVAGVEQADNTFAGYGQGAQGYAKRFGANYVDSFTDTMLAGAVLPSLFKQDPRYFVKGTGSVNSRIWYAIANSVICKGDSGHWQANYSAILGGLAAGGIANLYYPASDKANMTVTFEGAGLGIASGAVQNLFQEFLIKKLTPHFRHEDPTQQ